MTIGSPRGKLRLLLAGSTVLSACFAVDTARGQAFTDITEQSGLATVRAVRPDDWWASGLHFVDLDGDGRLDVFVSSHGSDGALAALGDGAGNFKAAAGNYPAAVH